ncbi:hypothetical protein HH308_10925 [Gordonia sp. TBRC 11910]|uniref:Cyclic nucleotide-binding protein n=2 Tax=Gordonia asplenii TaxID=2725283 RepID=A0A848KUN2_9ACTN|nr:hypothetical protein [Gordonia asplenii]
MGCRPFDALSPQHLAIAVAAARVDDVPVGALVIDAFAQPPTDIFVVLSGEVDVWLDADRIGSGPGEKLGPGDAFGFSAALAGRASGPRVTARTAAAVARFPLDVVMPAFASRDGARFLADHIAHARRLASGPPMFTVVADLVRTEPLLVDAADSVAELARKMTERSLPYAAVDTGDGRFGLVTDEILRRRVIAEGVSVDSPACDVMIHPAPTTSADTTSADALIEMLDHDVQFLLVTSADGDLRGAVGERDFVFASTTAGVSINEQIRRAHTTGDLILRARTVPAMLADILERGLTADRVIAVNSAIVDSIVRRALTLVFDAHSDLTTDAFTWLSLGSNGRREAVPSSDVDAAVTFDDAYADDIPRYREVFGEVGEVLTQCGISVDAHRAFPMHEGFSRTHSQWREAATGWLARPQENQGTVMAPLLVDARPIFGDPGLPEPARVFADFNRHPATMEMLLYESLARRAKISTMRDKLAGRGENFDVKARGLAPIINIARWSALGVGSTELQTTDRLRAAAGSRLLPQRDATRLIEAFETLQFLRLEHQLRQVEAGRTPDDILDLDEMSTIDQSVVDGTVREIAAIQKRMDRVAHMHPAQLLAAQRQPVDSESDSSRAKGTKSPARVAKDLAASAGIRKPAKRGRRSQ